MKVGSKRIEKTDDPEKAIDRALAIYLKKDMMKRAVSNR